MIREHKELYIEEYLFAHPEVLGDVRWLARQLTIASGQIDLLGVDNDSGAWLLIEVKSAAKQLLNAGVLQLLRYTQDVDEIMDYVFRGRNKPELVKILINGHYFENEVIRNAQAVGVDLYEFEGTGGMVVLRSPKMIHVKPFSTQNSAEKVKEAFEDHKTWHWGWSDEDLAASRAAALLAGGEG
jgi:hypothetical protein